MSWVFPTRLTPVSTHMSQTKSLAFSELPGPRQGYLVQRPLPSPLPLRSTPQTSKSCRGQALGAGRKHGNSSDLGPELQKIDVSKDTRQQ